METGEFFTAEEKRLLFVLYRKLLQLSGETLHKGDCRKLKTHLVNSIQNNRIQRDIFGLNPIIKDMQTAVIVAEEIGMRRASILGLMLHDSVRCGTCTAEEVERNYGEDVAGIIRGLIRVNELYAKSPTIESENFRNLLLSFAEDMRVILIMIADRVNIMRQIKECKNDEARRQVANEAAYLYAPLAHKLGSVQTEVGTGRPFAEVHGEGSLLPHQGETERNQGIARQVYSRFHRSGTEETGRGGTALPHQGTHQIHPLHLPEDEEAEVPFRGCVRPVCHPCNPGLPSGKGEAGVLAGIFHCNGYVPAQPEASARPGCPCPRATATNRCTSPSWGLRANGWKCRYAPNAWTR